ncbi:MAG: ABC transporter ATP-binding protein [Candidatus Cloacimonetes bacterium]|nr:ABC transporter ATP-binding protein [Candidatus Cloacimonadota bacterium]
MLKLDKLNVFYNLNNSKKHILKDVTFNVKSNTIIGIVGESGSGKTTIINSILQILPENTEITGKMYFEDILLHRKNIKQFRGNKFAYISQNFFNSLFDNYSIGYQFDLLLKSSTKDSKKNRKSKMLNALHELNFDNPEQILKRYTFEISGGMQQRILVAMAILLNPTYLFADEPTSAIDTSNKKKFLDLLLYIKNKLNTGILLVTHDISLIKEFADKIIVLYQGEILEIFNPQKDRAIHPYSKLLFEAKMNSKDKILVEKRQCNDYGNRSNCSFSNHCNLCDGSCLKKINKISNKTQFVKCNRI